MLAGDRTTNGANLRFGESLILIFVAGSCGLLASHARAEIKPVPLVQQTLSGLGFDAGAADGIWGQKSIAALKAFQRSKGLNPSGVIDPTSLHELFPASSPPAATASEAPPALPAVGQTATPPSTVTKPTQEQPRMSSWSVDPSLSSQRGTDGDGSGVAKFFWILIVLVAIAAFGARSKKRPASGKVRRRR